MLRALAASTGARAGQILRTRRASNAMFTPGSAPPALASRPSILASFFSTAGDKDGKDVGRRHKDKAWSDFSSEEQGHWRTLGWDENTWKDENASVWSEKMSWDELYDDDKYAAERLGFDEESWDKDKEGGPDWFRLILAVPLLMMTLFFLKEAYRKSKEEEEAWSKTKLSNDEREDIMNWVKPFADAYTHKTWEGRINHERELQHSAETIVAGMRDIFLQLAEDEEPRHVITKKSWLAHARGAASGQGREASLALFRAADIDHSDQLDFAEFSKLVMLMVVGNDPRVDPAAFAELLFVMLDQDGNGELTQSEVEAFLELARCAHVRSLERVSASDIFREAALHSSSSAFSDFQTITKEFFVATIGPRLATDFARDLEPNLAPKEVEGFRHTWVSAVCNGELAKQWESHTRTGGGFAGGGCFAPGTLVLTPSGTVSIEDLRPGDLMAGGGRVKATLQFDQRESAPLFDYRGVLVTGDHAVDVGEGHFVRVKNADGAKRLVDIPTENLVHDIITTDHRIPVAGLDGNVILFADYEEVDESEKEYDALLRQLNNTSP
jgi:hypothetical protein